MPPGHLWLSPEAEEIFGCAVGQFDGRFETWFSRIHPDDRSKFPDLEAQLRMGRRTFSFEHRFTSPGGTPKRLKWDGEALTDGDGKLTSLAGTVIEVPAQEPIRTARMPRDAWGSSADSGYQFHWEQDEHLRFVRFSGGDQMPIPGLDRAVGLRRWELPNAVPLHSTWKEHIRVLEMRRPFRGFEYRWGTGADACFVSSSGDPVFGPDGRFVGYGGTTLNITSRVLAQEEARQGRILLEHASRLGKLGAWALRVPEMEVTWSKGSRAVLGFASDSQASWTQALLLLEDEGRRRLQDALEGCIQRGEPFSVEVRGVTGTGGHIWLRIVGEAERSLVGPVRQLLGSIQDVSARKEDERRLRDVSERLTNTLESITEGFFTLDTQWCFTYVNRAAEAMMKRSRGELLGRAIWEGFPHFHASVFDREYRRAIAEARTVQFQAYSESLAAWVQVFVYPSPQGLAIYFQDVTQQKTAREALAASEERHRLLFETALDATFLTATDGVILAANPAACSMFGLTEQELCRRGRAGVVAKDDGRLRLMLEDLDGGGKGFAHLTLVRGDGSRFEAEVSAARYRASDGNTYAVVVARDITERLRQQDEILTLNETLTERVRERTSELERANGELKGFARSLAHDLRQPIAAAKAFSSALKIALAEGKGEESRHYGDQVLAAVKTMDAYVEALLSLAHISQVSLEIEEVDLGAIANQLLDQLQAQAPQRNLRRHVTPGMYAEGDVTLLRMLLQNLLANAWKFSSREEVSSISFTCEQAAEGHMVYCVRDNGAGFDMARAKKLFGSFQRFHDSADFPGTGIGLANAHRIVTRHGGRIWARSAPGKGAAFRFTLGRPASPQSRVLPLQL